MKRVIKRGKTENKDNEEEKIDQMTENILSQKQNIILKELQQ